MKFSLPDNHGLSPNLVEKLIHVADAAPSLTDAQYDALNNGVARGSSLLIVAPTSSGKTDVGTYALTSWLSDQKHMNRRAVYLTSHRALARQKFNEFIQFVPDLINCDRTEIVISTGDANLDGANEAPNDPLESLLIVATYEKFLGLIAGSGLRKDMSHYCIICDELQLINDPNRGSTVEVLLTLLKRANAGQIVGLSAVISINDGRSLADWLCAKLVHCDHRETPITYEVRSAAKTLSLSTDFPEEFMEGPGARNLTTIEIIKELSADARNTPIAVFCMRRQDVFDLARQWAAYNNVPEGAPDEIPPEFVEITSSAQDLACYAPYSFGYHSADLVDDERHFVEDKLDNNQFKVVFSTTTLAMGLNYYFKTVVFDRFKRWNFDRKQHEPIARAELHNIAGRAGRLGHASEGRVILSALTPADFRTASSYLNISEMDAYVPRLHPENFDNIVLQLLASGIVSDEDELFNFLQSTLSAQSALSIDRFQPEVWTHQLSSSLERLRSWGFIH